MRRFFLGFFAAMLLGTSASHAGMAGIHDNAGFFSERAKSEASRSIAELERTLRKDLAIETFNAIPDDMKKGVNLQDQAAVNRLFGQWAVRQAKQNTVNGIYVLLVREYSHIHVVVDDETQKHAFTLKDRDALVSTMLVKLRKKESDEALLDGVNFVLSTMRSHEGARAHGVPTHVSDSTRAASRGLSGWIIPVLIGLLATWLIVGIIRSVLGGGSAGGGTVMTPGSGGGGFFQSLLGGMFGAAAGMWMYDQFFGHHDSSALGAGPEGPVDGESGISGQETGYSDSGASFDDNSGGSDAGGGDSGGDSGGGDSGGGDF